MATSRKNMFEKLKIAEPFNIFYNEISDVPETLNRDDSVSFSDFFCPSLGELEESLHIVSKVDIDWLMDQFKSKGLENKPLTLLYGEEKSEMENIMKTKYNQTVKFHNVAVHDRFGSHHCKISIFAFKDSLRVVISSSNLYFNHWEHFNHCFWMSPACPALPKSKPLSAGDSPTNFKVDLLNFLRDYRIKLLDPWIRRVASADFSAVKVFLVTSHPRLTGTGPLQSHFQRMKNLLTENTTSIPLNWPVVIQSSCIGQYQSSAQFWLKPILLKALSGLPPRDGDRSMVQFHFIYPTKNQLEDCVFGKEIGEGFRYSTEVHGAQIWLKDHMCKWESTVPGRSKVMAHFKCYFRLSPDNDKMAWFLLTSANATRGAWGLFKATKPTNRFQIRNYEVGVLFVPRLFNMDTFNVTNNGTKTFPVLVDLPLTKYGPKDEPWTLDKQENEFRQKFEKLTVN